MNNRYYDYNDLNRMQEKTKKIDFEPDKKNFLKSMTPLEQKMALFYSSRPYEIINYLDCLNYEETNLMLSELNNEEISKLLERFNAEDKRNFYSTFSNSALVNKFISNDKNAFNHVDKLDFERKIELLDSSKVSTTKATEEIYDSLSVEEKKEVETKITSTEGSLVVDNVIENSAKDLENTILEEIESEKPQLNNQEERQHEEQQPQEENQEEHKKELQEQKEEKIEDQQEEKIEDQNLLNEFQKSKEDCEIEIIASIKQNLLENNQQITNGQFNNEKKL